MHKHYGSNITWGEGTTNRIYRPGNTNRNQYPTGQIGKEVVNFLLVEA